MKKMLFAVALLVGVSAFAQNPESNGNAKAKGKGKGKGKVEQKKTMTPEERTEKITGRLKNEMGLNEEQTGKVKAITLTRVQKMKELREKYKDSKDKTALKTERKAIFQAWENDLKAIVTPEQFGKYQAKKEERKKKLEEKRKNAGKKAESGSKEGEETLEELEEEVGE